jgi:hypothetical protein
MGRETVALEPRVAQDACVLAFLVLSRAPWPILFLTLALALYLTVIELRELQPHYVWWIWWLLFVFMTHFIGYLALRAYAAYRSWHARSG